MAIDRQGIIEAVYVQGRADPGHCSLALTEWSLPIDQLGEGAKYYQYDPKEAKRLLAEAGFPKGFKTQLNVTGRVRPLTLIDAVQLVQRYLKDVGIEAGVEDPGVWRLYCDHVRRVSSRAWSMGPR